MIVLKSVSHVFLIQGIISILPSIEKFYKIHKVRILLFSLIKVVVPYLVSRAQENSSVGGQTSREFSLVEKEMKIRGICFYAVFSIDLAFFDNRNWKQTMTAI